MPRKVCTRQHPLCCVQLYVCVVFLFHCHSLICVNFQELLTHPLLPSPLNVLPPLLHLLSTFVTLSLYLPPSPSTFLPSPHFPQLPFISLHPLLLPSSSFLHLPFSPSSHQVQLPSVKTASGKEQAQGYKFQFKTDLTPKSLVSLALSKKAKTVGSATREDAEDYILKVAQHTHLTGLHTHTRTHTHTHTRTHAHTILVCNTAKSLVVPSVAVCMLSRMHWPLVHGSFPPCIGGWDGRILV